MLATYVKRRRLLGAAAIAAGLPALARAAAARQLRIVTAELPPLAMEKGARPGALAELVNELCRRMQLAAAIEFVPWKRAIFLTDGQPATAIFPLSRLPEREARFRWLAPLFEENYVFLAPRGRAFDVRRPNAMKDKRITLIRASSLIPVVQGLGFHHIVEARSIDEVHRLLVRGMADAAFGEVSIVRNSLQRRRKRVRHRRASAQDGGLAGRLARLHRSRGRAVPEDDEGDGLRRHQPQDPEKLRPGLSPSAVWPNWPRAVELLRPAPGRLRCAQPLPGCARGRRNAACGRHRPR